jgi:hypothetical protein
MSRTAAFLIASVLLLQAVSTPVTVGAQDAAEEGPETSGPDADAESAAELPSGFSTVSLGMEVDTVKERLQEDPYFFYRGDPDVTLTPDRNQQLIEVEGLVYVARGFFQFEEEQLYIIILQLNPERMDYYTMYTELSGKYGEPAVFTPSQVVWESEAVRLSLERPVTVKYVDRQVFDRLVEEGDLERSQRQISRERFLEQF